MVVSLFPKRRRRRRWYGLPSRDVSDPPSFSEIQPEISVRDEAIERTVPVDVSSRPACRRKSAIGTSALRELSINLPETKADGAHRELPRAPCSSSTGVAESGRETTERQQLVLPATAKNSLLRRSSRLLESCGTNVASSSLSSPVLHSSRTTRRVSFSLSERISTLHPPKGPESLTSTRLSTLSDGEANSDYFAYVDCITDAGLTRNLRVSERAAATNQCANLIATAKTGTKCSNDKGVEQTTFKIRVGESELSVLSPVRESPRKNAAGSIEAPEVSRIKVEAVRKPERVKPGTSDARTSTTGLDRFVRSTRRKKSICVQIDLDTTTAFRSADSNDSDSVEARACSSLPLNHQGAPRAPESARVETDPNTTVTERGISRELSPAADPNATLKLLTDDEKCAELPSNEPLGGGCLEASSADRSHLGIDVSFRPTRKDRESITVSRAGALECQNSRCILVDVDERSEPVKDRPHPETEQALGESGKSANESNRSKKSKMTARDEPRSDAGISKHQTEPCSARSTVMSEIPFPAAEAPRGIPTSFATQPAQNESAKLTLRSPENLRPTTSYQAGLLETPKGAKRPRMARMARGAKRKSPGIDVLSVAQRIVKKIERKKVIENTIYRRVNLIYEGLWEDFLETYYPEKWLKVKDVWMERKAEKRLEEEKRGLGGLDDEMEREVQRGAELGAAKYIKEFERKRSKELSRRLADGISSRKSVKQTSFPELGSRRLSRRLRDLEPL